MVVELHKNKVSSNYGKQKIDKKLTNDIWYHNLNIV